jgi:hypothetical protein
VTSQGSCVAAERALTGARGRAAGGRPGIPWKRTISSDKVADIPNAVLAEVVIMTEFHTKLTPDAASMLVVKLADLVAQLRVDAEREAQMAYRSGAADVARTEARAYAKAILHVRERLEPLLRDAVSPDRREALESWVETEAARRLSAAMRADENRA